MNRLKLLQSKNGYKGIVLGDAISTLKKQNLSLDNDKPDANHCLTYSYNDSTIYNITSTTTLLTIGVSSYKNRIASIILLFNKSDGNDILLFFEKASGMPMQYK